MGLQGAKELGMPGDREKGEEWPELREWGLELQKRSSFP